MVNQGGFYMQLTPLKQSNSVSCGQTSVAMLINAITGKNFTDQGFDVKYGYSLLHGLNEEIYAAGYEYSDFDLNKQNFEKAIDSLKKGLPVICGTNTPFSVTGRGHIFVITALSGDTSFVYADPNGGILRTATIEALLSAQPYPQGSFLFIATRTPTDTIVPVKVVNEAYIRYRHSGKEKIKFLQDVSFKAGEMIVLNEPVVIGSIERV
jgi:hypothetical protein